MAAPHSPTTEDDTKSLTGVDAPPALYATAPRDDAAPVLIPPSRPPIDYSSAGAFFSSVGHRFSSIWTRRFVLSLLAGQVVSLCITCTNVTTT
jgi:hypothetical protein